MKPQTVMWIYENIVERVIGGIVGLSLFIGLIWFAVYSHRHYGWWSLLFVVPICGSVVPFVAYVVVIWMKRIEKQLSSYLGL